MTLYKLSISLVVSLFVLRPLAAENRFFYPEGMQGYPGEDVTIQLMLENDVQLSAYGFSSTFDTSAFKFNLPPEEALTWEGTAAESGNLTMLMASYDSIAGWFGGFAATMVCDPGVSPGEHIAVNIHIHIREEAIPATYIFGIPYPASPCQFTDCDAHDVEVNEYDGTFLVKEHIDLSAPASDTVNEGETCSFNVTATDRYPTAQICLWATDLPANASFDSTCGIGSVTVTFEFNPNYCQEGIYQVTFHGWDDEGHVTQKVTVINVNNVNRPPDMDGGPDRLVIPGDTLTFTVKATDLDYWQCADDTLTLSTIDLPGASTFSQDSDTTGIFSWTTTLDDTSWYTVTFFVEDKFGLADSDDVNIKVGFPEAPLTFSLLLPVDGDTVFAGFARIDWEDAHDADPGDSVLYDLWLSLDSDFSDPMIIDSLRESEYTFHQGMRSILSDGAEQLNMGMGRATGQDRYLKDRTHSLEAIPEGRKDGEYEIASGLKEDDTLLVDTTYYWKVRSYDTWGLETWSSETWQFYVAPGGLFLRGDVDGNGQYSIIDGIICLRCQFIPGGQIHCKCDDATDADDNGVVSIGDCLYVLRWLFIPGSPPPLPPCGMYPQDCGPDPTEDALECSTHTCMTGRNTATQERIIGGEFIFEKAAIEDDKLILPVYLSTSRELSGFAFTMCCDPSVLRFRSLETEGLITEHFDFISALPANGEVAVGAVVSFDFTTSLPKGSHHVADLVFEFKQLDRDICLKFTDAELVDENCKCLTATLSDVVVRDLKHPIIFEMSQNYPNPTRAGTTIRYQLPKSTHTTLTIYNLAGQVVKTLVNNVEVAGYYSVSWDGKNELGRKVSSGIYFYQLKADGYTHTRKLVIVE